MTNWGIVAGGSGALGSAVVAGLVRDGHRVLVLDRVAYPEVDSDVHSVCVDLVDEEQTAAAVGEATERWGAPSVLVNCQGWSPKDDKGRAISDQEMSAELFSEALRVNLLTTFLTMRTAIPLMAAAGRGRVVNVSSAAARTGRTTAAAVYAAAKAGVEALTRHFAVQYGPAGVLVCAVAPGKFVNPNWPDNAELVDAYQAEIPLGRRAAPAEVAELILFLASSANTYLTGQTVLTDGGRLS
ncbi:MAG TPA: SDR family oxidoreductase [Pseudonocardiaceae bacterium]|jgi:NAD(P)-dependent dehydrogenase (short-subunit alcohol dehydrogenase family)|nr:SDR family oxidoreductase [Pseudonocardiaceae bacterium]